MRWPFGALIVFAVVDGAFAAPVPGVSVARPVPQQLQADADAFSRELLSVATAIASKYVREVMVRDLLADGVHGLHEAARLPTPVAVLRDLEAAKTDDEVLTTLRRAREHLGDTEEVRGREAILAACRGMARKLDRHSGVVTGADLRRGIGVDEQIGFGLELEELSETKALKIQSVSPGGPAQAAGLRPGDAITHIGGEPVKDNNLLGLLKGSMETKAEIVRAAQQEEWSFQVTVRRGDRSWEVNLKRETFQPETVLGTIRRDNNSWTFWLDAKQKIAHVRIAGFGNTTALDLRTALDDLTRDGLRGLILDLRNCPGGYLKQAVQTAGLFLPKDAVIGTATGRVDGDTVFKNEAPRSYTDFPMVVLIDGDTTGGAEMIAAALQDHKRALIAGTRTQGKGNVQIHLPLGDDAGFKLTTRTLLRPSKKPMHRFPDSSVHDDWGVRPDEGLELRVSADLNKQMKEWWLLQTLRPGGCKERLPLDDPEVDTQRYAALEELLKAAGKPRPALP